MNKGLEEVDIQNSIGLLPKGFISLAFLNFIVGASLGGWMAVDSASWPTLSAIHGEINPFGWLTMLIYGMTYAVLVISAGIRPPKGWVGWLHLVLAELAVVIAVLGYLFGSLPLIRIAFGFQFAAPIVFLVNILSAVFAKKKMNRPDGADDVSQVQDTNHPLLVLSRNSVYKATDRIGQRGTDMSLMLFLVGAGWMFVQSLMPSGGGTSTRAPLFLVYYGWIFGTIFAVSLHLFPRFTKKAASAKAASLYQFLWGASVLLGTIGIAWSPDLAAWGYRLLGLSLTLFSAMFLGALLPGKRIYDRWDWIKDSSLFAWRVSFGFCLVLGCCLILGLNPLSLVALHLLFLGFATTLVYGIGTTLFPFILGGRVTGDRFGKVQIALAVVGASLMVIAFASLQIERVQFGFLVLSFGGPLALAAVILFILQFILARVRPAGEFPQL